MEKIKKLFELIKSRFSKPEKVSPPCKVVNVLPLVFDFKTPDFTEENKNIDLYFASLDKSAQQDFINECVLLEKNETLRVILDSLSHDQANFMVSKAGDTNNLFYARAMINENHLINETIKSFADLKKKNEKDFDKYEIT